MSALFVPPLPISYVSGSTPVAPTTGDNLCNDVMSLVWRGSLTGFFILDTGKGTPFDTLALIGTNLRSNDSVRIRTGTTITGTGSYDVTITSAWTGTAPIDGATATMIYQFPTTRTERWVRIDFMATAQQGIRNADNPDGFIQVSKAAIGKAVKTGGITYDAQPGFNDTSIVTEGPGYRSSDRYTVFPTMKFKTEMISDDSWHKEWYPLLAYAGNSRPILFVMDDSLPNNFQTDAIYGCFTSKVAVSVPGTSCWTIEGNIQASGV